MLGLFRITIQDPCVFLAAIGSLRLFGVFERAVVKTGLIEIEIKRSLFFVF